MTRRRRDERGGSAAVELAMLIPVIIAVVMLAVAGGRLALAHGAVQQAATDAARAASLARTSGDAHTDAATAASASLGQATPCRSIAVGVDMSGFAAPVGTPAVVRATVTCTVALADLGVPGLPGTKTVTASMVSPLDTYRART